MKKYCALSIVYPAVENIINGSKKIEIRSWIPLELPLRNLILIENKNYLNDGDIDLNGQAKAIVDVIGYKKWTYEDFSNQGDEVKLGREWKKGYFVWFLDNVRKIDKYKEVIAKKGIYTIELDI
ncbi:hypothetical protein CBJ89_003397 [Salmonella enterica subsp. enterica serovar Essen]|nr:hypothetical protein [Salmonella enterica subsp. enterica serovar Essen]